MHLSISKNAPSLMAMTLAIFISPAGAKKKSAKTAAASTSAASTAAASTAAASTAATPTASTTAECFWVVESWQLMGKTTSVSPTHPTACCNYVVSSTGKTTGKTTTQTSGIPGVNCTSTGIVTQINWWGLGLVNTIPAELGRLTNLTYLNLGDNWLGGSIPPEIWNLVKLEYLDFYYNFLTGSIPPELGNFTNLRYLSLACQSLSGSIPSSLGNLRNLQGLSIWGNKFTGSIPPELGNLVSLQSLELGGNQLNGSIPSELGNLVNLQVLNLADNQLSGPIPSSLGKLVKLETIWLFDIPRLTGTLTPQCQTTSGVIPSVWIDNTNITICGCAAASTAPSSFPPDGTPDECLATGPARTLSKRTQTLSQVIAVIDYRSFTCSTDTNKNPYADCLNTIAKICDTTDPTWSSNVEKRDRCRNAVNDMFGMMNEHWQRVRKQCGQWSFSTYPADPSDNCDTANSNLIDKAVYTRPGGVQVPVTELIESIKARLWNKVTTA